MNSKIERKLTIAPPTTDKPKMKIEKYSFKGKLAGWQVDLVQPDGAKKHETRRFSCSEYGDMAFQEALKWVENQYLMPLFSNTSA